MEDPDTLEGTSLDITVTGGSGSGYSFGFLDTGLLQPGTLTLPVEQGKFC